MKLTRTLVVLLAFGMVSAFAAPGYAENGAETAVTYYKDVLPIMQENCQTCHRPSGYNISGLIAPMSFMDYRETRPWARAIASKVEAREMPPWFASAPKGVFENERGLTDAEIDTLVRWVEAGAPAGDAAHAPPAKQWAEDANDGWMLGTPDFVVKMPEPYLIEDDIYDINITFYAKLTEDILPEDTWVKGWEFRVGDNAVTHHMCSSVISPNAFIPAEAVEDEGADVPDSQLLSCVAEGWRLEIRTSGADDGDTVHVVPLNHTDTAAAAPVFTASVHATAAETGRLALRWGRQAWSSDFRFEELPPAPRRARVSGRGTPRQASDDNSPTARNNMLNERNETALVLPDGARISMLYWKGIDIEDEDYPRLAATADGTIVEMIRAPVIRLKSDVSLRFGEADVPTGNLAPGFAGAYGVWLRKAGAGWRFVFNHEPDSWGTQHDQDFDAAETAVEYSRSDGSFRPLGATLVPTGDDQGRLVVHWGPHEWAADFTVVR